LESLLLKGRDDYGIAQIIFVQAVTSPDQVEAQRQETE
jgi:hypothetical protein